MSPKLIQTRPKTTISSKPEAAIARMYKVLLLNDDYTSMDFVIDVLMQFFNKDAQSANQIMFEVHFQGRGVCGVYTRDIAETKVVLVNAYSRQHGHPLLCCMEPE